MSEQHRLLDWLVTSGETKALVASVIHVEGSAYRHQGAQMIIGESGRMTGMISGGCLEEDLRIRAFQCMKEMKTAVVDYDMRAEDDLGWGKGAGCNGKVYVSLTPLDLTDSDTDRRLIAAHTRIDQGETLYRVTALDEPAGAPVFVKADGMPLSEGDFALKPALIREKDGPAVRVSDGDRGRILMERITPKTRVYVFGAGIDAEPVVRQLAALDFDVIVTDTVKERLDRTLFPDAAGFRWLSPEDFFQCEEIREGSFALVMTHRFQDDQVLLRGLIERSERFAYTGILGPRRRTRRLVAGGQIPDWLHSPVGLAIGADGAEEIAVSIAAELIQIRRNRAQTKSEQAVM